jgi:hypothetical protein
MHDPAKLSGEQANAKPRGIREDQRERLFRKFQDLAPVPVSRNTLRPKRFGHAMPIAEKVVTYSCEYSLGEETQNNVQAQFRGKGVSPHGEFGPHRRLTVAGRKTGRKKKGRSHW